MPQQAADKSLVIRDAFLGWYAHEEKAPVEEPETYRLLGVIAGEHGSAVLRLTDGRSVAVRVGDEIAPGVKLVALESDQITIERAGSRQVIKLPQQTASAAQANGQFSAPTFYGAAGQEGPQAVRTPYPMNRTGRMPGAAVQAVTPVTGDRSASAGSSLSQAASSDNAGISSGAAVQQSSQSASSTTTGQTNTQTSTVVQPATSATSLPTVALTRGQLQDLIPNTSTPGWSKGLSWAGDSGARIDDLSAQAFYAVLQLKAGDILKRVNDRQLTQLSDMSYVFQAFRLRASVDLVLVRGSSTYTVRYTISNTLTPITLSRGQLLSIVQGGNVSNWTNGLSTASEGGIRVDDATIHPMSKPLQLRTGDILKSINGTQIKDVSDISLFIQAFGQLSAVDLEIVRDGLTLTQHYDIQP